jgi:hypothetical protein
MILARIVDMLPDKWMSDVVVIAILATVRDVLKEEVRSE